MATMNVPTEGAPAEAVGSDQLMAFGGGNAFMVMGTVKQLLKRAGATKAFTDAYLKDAMSGNNDHLLAVSVAYLDAEANG